MLTAIALSRSAGEVQQDRGVRALARDVVRSSSPRALVRAHEQDVQGLLRPSSSTTFSGRSSSPSRSSIACVVDVAVEPLVGDERARRSRSRPGTATVTPERGQDPTPAVAVRAACRARGAWRRAGGLGHSSPVVGRTAAARSGAACHRSAASGTTAGRTDHSRSSGRGSSGHTPVTRSDTPGVSRSERGDQPFLRDPGRRAGLGSRWRQSTAVTAGGQRDQQPGRARLRRSVSGSVDEQPRRRGERRGAVSAARPRSAPVSTSPPAVSAGSAAAGGSSGANRSPWPCTSRS